MRIADFDYPLPPELIAQHPLPARTQSRLLHVDPASGTFTDRSFEDLRRLVRPGDLLVLNDTRVVKARLTGVKASGGGVEVLVERVLGSGQALAQVRASKPPRTGAKLSLAEGRVPAEVLGREGEFFRLRFAEDDVFDLLERHGTVPLPPYIDHPPDACDETRYQTVFARRPGAVAAPTAGLHFDEEMLRDLQDEGASLAWVTLHVGAGTFQPVRVEEVGKHVMHAERFEVPEQTVAAVQSARAAGGRVLAVGTTSLRALEAAAAGGELAAAAGETRLFITPGYRFRVVDRLLTNFHLPKSTLLMLVAAFGGLDLVRRAYAHAVARRYRFFSYGDAMLLERATAAAQGSSSSVR